MAGFNTNGWIRKSFNVSFDERPPAITDFTSAVTGFSNTYDGGIKDAIVDGAKKSVIIPPCTATFTSYAAFFTTDIVDAGAGSSEAVFLEKFKQWETYAAYYVMRRYVMTVGLIQRVSTNSVTATDMDSYLDTDSLSPKPAAAYAGGFGGAYPAGEGKWFIESYSVEDSQDQFSNCSMSIRSLGKWKLIKIGTGTPGGPT